MGKNAYWHLSQKESRTHFIELWSNLCQMESWYSWIHNLTFTRFLPGLCCCWWLLLTLSPYIRAIRHSFLNPFFAPNLKRRQVLSSIRSIISSITSWSSSLTESLEELNVRSQPTSKSPATNEFYQPQTCSRQCGPARQKDLCQRSPSGRDIGAG